MKNIAAIQSADNDRLRFEAAIDLSLNLQTLAVQMRRSPEPSRNISLCIFKKPSRKIRYNRFQLNPTNAGDECDCVCASNHNLPSFAEYEALLLSIWIKNFLIFFYFLNILLLFLNISIANDFFQFVCN